MAKIAAHCVAKAIRKRNTRFVAVSCHYDIEEWLQPDWVVNMVDGSFAWRCLQRRPAVQLEIHHVSRVVWPLFAPHHYMSGDLHCGSQCFGGFIDGQIVAFAAYLHFPHAKVRDIKHGTRLVVLPDFQGLGIGGRMDDWIGGYLYARGYRYRNVVAHPAMIAQYCKSPRWRNDTHRSSGGGRTTKKQLAERRARGALRRVHSFEYIPTPDERQARKETRHVAAKLRGGQDPRDQGH